jgi:hypothetical protein
MIYKVPCPTRTNGVRLFKVGDQIAVEYEKGEPYVGKMAFDSALGSMARDVTIRPKRKVGYDEMPKAGQPPLDASDDADPDDISETISNLMSYLNDKLTPEQLNAVSAILGGADDDGPDLDAGERQATDRRRVARLAADQARHRPMEPIASAVS